MSEQTSQDDLICAFLDEELSDAEIDALLAQLECRDTRARACRQTLIGSSLLGQRALIGDISDRVRQAISVEAPAENKVVPLVARRRGIDWKVPAGGLALAASVAMVAIVAVRPGAAPDGSAVNVAAQQGPAAVRPADRSAADGDAQTAATRELVIAAPERSRPVVARWGSAESGVQAASTPAALREQLDAYLLNHARSGGGSALSGSLGYARVAASPQQHSEEPPR